MRQLILLLVFLTFPGLAAAVPYVYPYNWMTGEAVVRKLTVEPANADDDAERTYTHNYLNGMKDGTQGTVWCFKGYILPHELNLDLAWAIKKRNKPSALEGNAAPFVLAELRRLYPCGSKKKSKS